jgi:ATP synthase protein I
MSGYRMYMSLTKDKKEVFRSLISYSSLGLEMGLSVAIGIGIGYFLDAYFKTSPYLTIIFMLFGVAAAFKTIFTLMRKIEREDKRDHDK